MKGLLLKNKKGQTAGIVTALVLGIATLVVGIIIAFVVVSSLTNANLLQSTRPEGQVLNEFPAFINETGYTLDAVNSTTTSYSITTVNNATTAGLGFYNFTLTSGNYTLSSGGVLTNATATTYPNVSINYTYTSQSAEEISSNALSANLTSGVDNVSAKIPTVLLIAAIVLILGILAVLVAVWQKMRFGSSSRI